MSNEKQFKSLSIVRVREPIPLLAADSSNRKRFQNCGTTRAIENVIYKFLNFIFRWVSNFSALEQSPKVFSTAGSTSFRNKIKSLFKFFNVAPGMSPLKLSRRASGVGSWEPTGSNERGEKWCRWALLVETHRRLSVCFCKQQEIFSSIEFGTLRGALIASFVRICHLAGWPCASLVLWDISVSRRLNECVKDMTNCVLTRLKMIFFTHHFVSIIALVTKVLSLSRLRCLPAFLLSHETFACSSSWVCHSPWQLLHPAPWRSIGDLL